MESEILKQILGDELFKKFEEKLKAYNENPQNKDCCFNLSTLRYIFRIADIVP